jgi:hypothetical protein
MQLYYINSPAKKLITVLIASVIMIAVVHKIMITKQQEKLF